MTTRISRDLLSFAGLCQRNVFLRIRAWILCAIVVAPLCSCQTTSQRSRRLVRRENFHFNFEHSGLSEAQAQALATEAVQARDTLKKHLGDYFRHGEFITAPGSAFAPPPDIHAKSKVAKLPINVVVTQLHRRSFTDATGITIARSGVDKDEMTHELVHHLFGASWNPIDEGLAVYLTEEIRGPAGEYDIDTRSLVYAKLGKLKPLTHKRIKREGMTRVDYDAAGSFVRWLVTEYGCPKFFQLYRGPANNYQWVYGKSEFELRDNWLRSIDTPLRRDSRGFYRFRAFISGGLQQAK